MRLVIAAISAAILLSTATQPVSACIGMDAPLVVGMRGATSIFYARIVSVDVSSVGFHRLTLEVGEPVRGNPQRDVTRVIPAEVCTPLSVGDFGLVVLGSIDPFGVGPDDTYNFFYVIGPGRLSAAEAARVLSAAPATDSVAGAGSTPPRLDLAYVLFGPGGVAFVAMLLRPPKRLG